MQEETERDVTRLQQTKFTSKKARATAFKDAGVARLHCFLQYFPEGNLEIDAKKDIMHLFLNGITRHEGLWMVMDLVAAGCFTWDQLNVARKRLSVPKGHTIPHMEPPRSEGKTLSQRTLVMNAAGVMHFAVNRYDSSCTPHTATRTYSHCKPLVNAALRLLSLSWMGSILRHRSGHHGSPGRRMCGFFASAYSTLMLWQQLAMPWISW